MPRAPDLKAEIAAVAFGSFAMTGRAFLWDTGRVAAAGLAMTEERPRAEARSLDTEESWQKPIRPKSETPSQIELSDRGESISAQ
jgi:hypothetical protein